MFRNNGNNVRKVALVSILTLGLACVASAQAATPSTGLGQSWPNAADVSSSPQWHVYVFMLNGIKYIQVNDLNGTVHAAIAAANGVTIALPMGVDAANVNTQPTATKPSSNATTVYSDSATAVTAAPQSDGTTKFTVNNIGVCPEVYNCTGGAVVSPLN